MQHENSTKMVVQVVKLEMSPTDATDQPDHIPILTLLPWFSAWWYISLFPVLWSPPPISAETLKANSHFHFLPADTYTYLHYGHAHTSVHTTTGDAYTDTFPCMSTRKYDGNSEQKQQ